MSSDYFVYTCCTSLLARGVSSRLSCLQQAAACLRLVPALVRVLGAPTVLASALLTRPCTIPPASPVIQGIPVFLKKPVAPAEEEPKEDWSGLQRRIKR